MMGSPVGVRSGSEKLVIMENVTVGLFRVSVLKFLAFSFQWCYAYFAGFFALFFSTAIYLKLFTCIRL